MSLIKAIVGQAKKTFSPAAAGVDWQRIQTLVHGPGASSYETERGGDVNSALFACLMSFALSYPEPPFGAFQRVNGRDEWLDGHPIMNLFNRPTPNGEFTMEEIWFWTAWAERTDGNAYWLKVRSGDAIRGNVVEVWPVSPTLISPYTAKDNQGRPLDWVTHYKMRVGPHPDDIEEIPKENVVHFRLGVDPRDMRLGISPLKRLAREISTDDEATLFTEALLRNYGVPGLVVIPKNDVYVDEDDARRLRARFEETINNDGRGSMLVMSDEVDLEAFGFSPKQMDLSMLHRIPEERIAAVVGVPPIVAGLGAGLERSTFANFKEAREAFTEQSLAPAWRTDGARATISLRPDFTRDSRIRLGFDLTGVRALQEDQNMLSERLDRGVKTGYVLRNEARVALGYDPIEGWDEEDTAPKPDPMDIFGNAGGNNPDTAADEGSEDEDEQGQEGEKSHPFEPRFKPVLNGTPNNPVYPGVPVYHDNGQSRKE